MSINSQQPVFTLIYDIAACIVGSYCAIARKFTFKFANDHLRMHLKYLVDQLHNKNHLTEKHFKVNFGIKGQNESNYYSWKQQIEPTNKHKMKFGPFDDVFVWAVPMMK